MESDIDILENIQRVNAPDLDYTTFAEKVAFLNKQKVSTPIMVSVISGVLLLVSLNIVMVSTFGKQKPQHADDIQYLSLVNNNSLYQ